MKDSGSWNRVCRRVGADVGRFIDVEEIPSGSFCVSRNYETRSLVSLGKECGSGGEWEPAPSAALSSGSQT